MNDNCVIGLCGLPGAGKSHLARQLAEHAGWLLLDRDRIRAELFGARSDSAATRAAEQAMATCMVESLYAGRAVILDGMTLARGVDRRHWARAAQAAGGQWVLLYLDCPLALARERVAADRDRGGHPAPDRDPALVERVAARLETPGPEESPLVLDGGDPPGVEELLGRLRALGEMGT